MVEVRQTDIFSNWYEGLRDARARSRIDARVYRLEHGNFGNVKYFGRIGELRIDYGPGYRIYFSKRGDVVVILLCGGDKGSQKRDIAAARRIAEELNDGS